MSEARARSQRVLRCECGQFVRLDRALAERRSDPVRVPEAAPELDLSDSYDDENTRMFTSLADVPTSNAPATRELPRLDEEEDFATHISHTPMTLRALAAATGKVQSPAVEKPLWFVDLGVAGTVEMTIEQLIIARRSGKLGEGALVWRAGMPQWRPVGTLIPATGSSPDRNSIPPAPTSRPSQPSQGRRPSQPSQPSQASRPSQGSQASRPGQASRPSRPPQVTPESLGSYDRPLATLEFALEKETSAPRPNPVAARGLTPPPAPLRAGRSSRPPLAPPPASRSMTPPPGPLPVRGATPLPFPTPPPRAPSAPPPAPRRSASVAPSAVAPSAVAPNAVAPVVDRPSGESAPIAVSRTTLPSDPPPAAHPRFRNAGLAAALCLAASASGAFIVYKLKTHQEPMARASAASAMTLTPPPAAPPPPPQAVPPATSTAPQVVDVGSLTVEHRKAPERPRAAPQLVAAPVNAPVKAAPKPATDSDSSGTGEAAPAPTGLKRMKTVDLPAAAQSNPYTTGPAEELPTAKPAAPAAKPAAPAATTRDEPGF